jgi:hypothetical protein
MYSWIFRHLPFGRVGRIVGSLVLTAAIAATLWYAVFPNIEQYMPFTDAQITTDNGGDPGGDSVGGNLPGPDEIPYSTASNAPPPSPTKSR